MNIFMSQKFKVTLKLTQFYYTIIMVTENFLRFKISP